MPCRVSNGSPVGPRSSMANQGPFPPMNPPMGGPMQQQPMGGPPRGPMGPGQMGPMGPMGPMGMQPRPPMRRGTSKIVPVVVSAGLAIGVFCGLLFGLGTKKVEADPQRATNGVKRADDSVPDPSMSAVTPATGSATTP